MLCSAAFRLPPAAVGSARASCSANSSKTVLRSAGLSRCSRSSTTSRWELPRTLLAKFGLGAEDVLRAASSLSPGERTRAGLALLTARRQLPRPRRATNHLDVEAIEELEQALATYDGTVLLVTHDRRFLEAFSPTRTIEV
jgi:ATPase subunit of ABC transporter with duplicated ATPase domains